MRNIYFLIICTHLLSSCSFDTSSNFWDSEQENTILQNKSILVGKNKEFNIFKEEILEYSDKEDYPDISK